MADTKKNLFEVKDVSVQFGGLRASDHVSFDVKEGEIFGLPVRMARKDDHFQRYYRQYCSGGRRYHPEWQIIAQDVAGQDCAFRHQPYIPKYSSFPQMTVAENVAIGYHCKPMYSRLEAMLGLPSVRRAEEEVKRKVAEMLDIFGLTEYADMRAGNLAYGLQRKLEIARALATSPKLLLLDEPAAGMNNDECIELSKLLRYVQKKFDVTIIIIEHHIDLVVDLCDRICVL